MTAISSLSANQIPITQPLVRETENPLSKKICEIYNKYIAPYSLTRFMFNNFVKGFCFGSGLAVIVGVNLAVYFIGRDIINLFIRCVRGS